MPVFKNKTQGYYVNVCKDILKNQMLNLRDRGMLVTLLSLPDNWDFSIAGLSRIIPDGKSSIQASLAHLEELGYVTREQGRKEHGKFEKNTVEVHETPIAPCTDFLCTEKPSTDNPYTDKPSTENQPQYINNKYTNQKGITHPSINQQCEGDGMEKVRQLRELIAEQIHLNDFYEIAKDSPSEQKMIREIYDTICDVVCFPKDSLTIRGTRYPGKVVKSQFMKLTPGHIANILGRLIDNSLEIQNMEAYLISTLYTESLSGTLKEQADLHDDYLKYLRGNPYADIF